jgi:hypothetical protein
MALPYRVLAPVLVALPYCARQPFTTLVNTVAAVIVIRTSVYVIYQCSVWLQQQHIYQQKKQERFSGPFLLFTG